MEESILKLLSSARPYQYTKDTLAHALGLQRSSELIQLANTLDAMEEAYQIVRNNNRTYATAAQAGYVTGIIHINRRGTGFLDRENEDSIMVPADQLTQAMNGDTVLVNHIHYDPESDKLAGRLLKILNHSTTVVVGTFKTVWRHLRFIPDDELLRDRSIDLRLPKGFLPQEGLKIICTIRSYDTPLVLDYEASIGNVSEPGVDILSVLLEHCIDPVFPEEVKQQVQSIPTEVQSSELEGRINLTEDPTVTIDGDDSKDFDDAVSVAKDGDGWRLRVSIADVSHYVTQDSPLDQEAYKRGCSTYVTDRVVPMLPEELSNGICSLNPHVVRLTNTCEMHVASDGTVTSRMVYPSYIRSFARMTYHNVNRILDGDEQMQKEYSFLGTLFFDLRDCADAIRSQRTRQGAIDFDTPEAEIIVDENGHPTDIRMRQRGHAERMIEDCMIAANVAIARLMSEKDIPSIYRIHEAPKPRKLKEFQRIGSLLHHPFTVKGDITPKTIQAYLHDLEDTPEYPILSMAMLRCMQKARYDRSCLGHFGLAEQYYLHFTSPIRRYPDLVVHRMLRKYIYEASDASHYADNKRMDDAAEQSSIRERASVDAEFACEDMKKAEYMQDHLGEVMEGIISSVTSFGFFVQLPNTIEGLVSIRSLPGFFNFDADRLALVSWYPKAEYHVGMKVSVIVTGANKEEGKIDFELVSTNARKPEDKAKHTEARHDREHESHAGRGHKKTSFDRRSSHERRRSAVPKSEKKRDGFASHGQKPYNRSAAAKKRTQGKKGSGHGFVKSSTYGTKGKGENRRRKPKGKA